MNKSEVENVILDFLVSNLKIQQEEMDELLAAMSNDTKSTAGDKHETSRAMAQLEQEKLGKQISDLQLQKQQFISNHGKSNSKINAGSLVETSIGWFYIGIPIGQLKIGTTTVFCMSVIAPLGKALLNKSSGECIEFNGRMIEIRMVC